MAAQGAPDSSAFLMGPHQDGKKSIKNEYKKRVSGAWKNSRGKQKSSGNPVLETHTKLRIIKRLGLEEVWAKSDALERYM